MRVGDNPNRSAAANNYTPVVLTCVTHMPNQVGYHAKRLEVIQTCLTTMREGHEDKTMIVWDNASCRQLRNWLQYDFEPDVLILSENIGKNSARTSMARMLPPDRIMTYSDDDIYFYDGWLEPQLELIEHFPNVACVTGYPVRTSFRWGCDNTLAWAKENGKLEEGRFIPREWENEFAISIGREPKDHERTSLEDNDYRVTYNGKQAYCTSHHCQFVAPVRKVNRIVQYWAEAMPDEKPFDIMMDKIGLRLATTQRYTRHIGNVIDNNLRHVITGFDYPISNETIESRVMV